MTDGDTLGDLGADLFSPDPRRAGVGGLLDVLAARPGERAEDVLLDLKLIDDERLALALALRGGRPFQGLRGFIPDGRLFLYLPLALAVEQRLVPLALVGDRMVLASAFLDPDLSYLQERFPALGLELVIAPRREILEALGRVG
jgi:hypothetical protein